MSLSLPATTMVVAFRTLPNENGGSSSSSVFHDGLAVKSLEDIHEPSLDPRVSLSPRPDAEALDITLSRQLSHFVRPHPPDLEKSPPTDEVSYVGVPTKSVKFKLTDIGRRWISKKGISETRLASPVPKNGPSPSWLAFRH